MIASQLATVAVEILPHLEREAAARRQATQIKNGRTPVPEKIPGPKKSDARDEAAALVGVNPRYVSDAKRIAQESPEDFDAAAWPRGTFCVTGNARTRGCA